MAIKQALGEAHVEIVARLDRLEKDFKEARKRTDRTAKDMEKGFGQITRGIGGARIALGAFAAGLAALGGAAGIGTAIKRNLEFLDSLDKVSSKLGVSTDFLQQAQYAASQSGIEFNTLSMAMQRFTRRAGEANKGLGEARDAIKELGLQLTDSSGRMRSTEELFTDAMAALARIDDPADRLRLAFKLFDSEGAVLVNLADNFEELAIKAQRMGLVVDETVIKRGVNAKDELDTLSKVVRANLAGALVDLAPVLIGIGQHLSYVAQWAAEAWARLSDILNLQPTNVEALRDRISELDQLIEEQTEELRFYNRELDATGTLWQRLTRSIYGPKLTAVTETTIEGLREERRKLQEQLALMESQRTQIEPPGMPQIAPPEELTAKFKELWKERDRALKQWTDEAQTIEKEWDHLSDSASASMARMVADGEISFRALGQAFIHEFTERVLRSLVFQPIFQAIAGLAGGMGFTTEFGPYSEAYRFDPSQDPLGGFKFYTEPFSSTSLSTPTVQIFNTTGAPVQTEELFGGDVRVFIGKQGAQDILMGGDMAQALESRYALSARGVRK